MRGVRFKINTGFLCIAVILLFAGMVSLFELNRMSERTKTLLESSTYRIDVQKRMLDAVQEQNSALLAMVVLEYDHYDPLFVEGKEAFDKALTEASEFSGNRAELDSIYLARENYNKLVASFFDDKANTDVKWFLDMYRTTYNELTRSIKDYMKNSQRSLIRKAVQLEDNAYRAIMPGIITLGVAILMVLMFMFLLDLYYTKPIQRMNKALSNYMKHGVPFNVQMEGRDELFRLKESIEDLIMVQKSNKTEVNTTAAATKPSVLSKRVIVNKRTERYLHEE